MRKLTFFLKYLVHRYVFYVGLGGFFAVIVSISGAFIYYAPQLPEISQIKEIPLQIPLRLYDRRQVLLGEYGEKRRIPVDLDETPPRLIKAFIAAEDNSFYSHPGVDYRGLLRAIRELVTRSDVQTGGSTITMQVARNYLLSSERTITRKIKEIFLSFYMERHLSKDEIIELYINKIFLGKRAYGVAAAAQVYYDKSIDQLKLAQLAMIAGLPKAPSLYNPVANPDRARDRRNWILKRMRVLGYISPEEYATASTEPITAGEYSTLVADYNAYAAETVRAEAEKLLGSDYDTKGYEVYTTLDGKLQYQAFKTTSYGILNYARRHGYRSTKRNVLFHDDQDNISTWLEILNNHRLTPEIGVLKAAFVFRVAEKEVAVLLKSGETVTISWANGLKQARSYIDVNTRGSAPKQASDVLKRGDLIFIYQDENGQWQLGQQPEIQAALIAMNPKNGAIIAISGGFDFYRSHFNHATQAKRQAGSTFKPFIYAAAFEAGFTAASIINDAPVVVDTKEQETLWRPQNSGRQFYGPIRLRQALYQSRNLVTIRLLRKLTVSAAIDYINEFGFSKLNKEKYQGDLSLALGSYSTTPLELSTAYCAFANGGYKVSPYLIQTIKDADGQIIYQANPATVDAIANVATDPEQPIATNETEIEYFSSPDDNHDDLWDSDTVYSHESGDLIDFSFDEDTGQSDLLTSLNENLTTSNTEDQSNEMTDELVPIQAPRIIEERIAYIMNNILQDVIIRGTAKRAKALERTDIAGKTGTTNGPVDAWFAGYHPDLVAVTWLGFDDNRPMGINEYGGVSALPMWVDFMRVALQDLPAVAEEQPVGLSVVRIDPKTGLRSDSQRDGIFEIFRNEMVPEKYSRNNYPLGFR